MSPDPDRPAPFDPGRLGGYRDQAAKRLNQIAESVLSDPESRRWFTLAAGDAWIRSAEGVGASMDRWGDEMSDDERLEFVGRMGQAFFAWVLLSVTTKAIENPRDEELRALVWEMLESRPRLFDLDGPPDVSRA